MTRNEYKLYSNEELVDARSAAVKIIMGAGTDAADLYETRESHKRRTKKVKQAKRLLRKMVREFRIRNLPIEGDPEIFTGKPETPFVMMEWAVERRGEWTQHANKGDCIVYIRKRKAWWKLDWQASQLDYLLSGVRIYRWDSGAQGWLQEASFNKNYPEHRVY